MLPIIFLGFSCDDSNGDADIVNQTEEFVSTSPQTNINFEELHSTSDYADLIERKNLAVYRDQSTYEQALADITTDVPHTVDFDGSVVVLVSMGERSSGGYSINVTSATETDDYVTLEISSTLPGGNCAVDQALTQPFSIVKVDSTKEILFTEQLQITSC